MRLLYLTDTHIQGGMPQNRKDDFLGSMHDKFMELIDLCQTFRIDFMIHCGDLFDVPLPDPRSLEMVRRLFKQLELPVYCIAGNHDLTFPPGSPHPEPSFLAKRDRKSTRLNSSH